MRHLAHDQSVLYLGGHSSCASQSKPLQAIAKLRETKRVAATAASASDVVSRGAAGPARLATNTATKVSFCQSSSEGEVRRQNCGVLLVSSCFFFWVGFFIWVCALCLKGMLGSRLQILSELHLQPPTWSLLRWVSPEHVQDWLRVCSSRSQQRQFCTSHFALAWSLGSEGNADVDVAASAAAVVAQHSHSKQEETERLPRSASGRGTPVEEAAFKSAHRRRGPRIG